MVNLLVNELRDQIIPRTVEDRINFETIEKIKREAVEQLQALLNGVSFDEYNRIRGIIRGYSDTIGILRMKNKEFTKDATDDDDDDRS